MKPLSESELLEVAAHPMRTHFEAQVLNWLIGANDDLEKGISLYFKAGGEDDTEHKNFREVLDNRRICEDLVKHHITYFLKRKLNTLVYPIWPKEIMALKDRIANTSDPKKRAILEKWLQKHIDEGILPPLVIYSEAAEKAVQLRKKRATLKKSIRILEKHNMKSPLKTKEATKLGELKQALAAVEYDLGIAL